MFGTLAFYSAGFYRDFSAYTARVLQEIGLNYGALFSLIYVGKHPGCTPSQLVNALELDWGYGQRTLQKLEESGFLTRTKEGRSYRLELCEKGQEAFKVSHQVFFDWDRQALAPLTQNEREQLTALLEKVRKGKMQNP